MTTEEEFRELALSLHGTEEVAHFDRRAFKVRRIFASLEPNGDTANLYLTPPEQEQWCDIVPGAFAPVPNKWGSRGWTQVWLAHIKLDDLHAALRAAWSNCGGAE
ncbi:MmcQ/YjbR family DNA-binding protein [Rhodophyticola sp.]|jgi:hypothetical protein|uniref:MmcQ/YjbR family DNA-binding protein n=1 Tax=Rhodophyticola sp. TaxID=2680032 RepID=UPI003D2C81E9